jgi:hypothetical protein
MKLLPGGSFSEYEDGIIEVEHFSLFGMFGKKKYYAFCTYYIPRGINIYHVHITVTPNLKLLLKEVKNEYEGSDQGESRIAKINGDEISLETLTNEQTWEKDGWKLAYLATPMLKKDHLDNYEPGTIIPYFSLSLKLSATPQSLTQQIIFKGVEPPTFIAISREPVLQGLYVFIS